MSAVIKQFIIKLSPEILFKYSRNLQGATHTIQEYALLSVQAIYAQLLLFSVDVWYHLILDTMGN